MSDKFVEDGSGLVIELPDGTTITMLVEGDEGWVDDAPMTVLPGDPRYIDDSDGEVGEVAKAAPAPLSPAPNDESVPKVAQPRAALR